MKNAENIENVKVDEIKPYENNPRKNDDAVIKVMASIQRFGFKVPIILDNKENKEIVCGHTRWKAAKKLNMETVPCLFAEDLSEEEIRAFRLADNKVAEFATWDLEMLELEIESLDEIDMSEFGFDSNEESKETEKEIVEDEIPEEEEEQTRVKLGQIWKLGKHRLICGDSLNPKTLENLMGGERADMVFTDPPYGMKKEKDGVENDNLNFDDLLEFNKKWIPISFEYLKMNGSWYCWGIEEPLMDIYSNILKPMKKLVGEEKLTYRNLITWDKGSGQGQLSPDYRMYPLASEKCLFVMRGRQTYGDTMEDYWEGFEPIRQAFIKIKEDLKLSTQDVIEYAGATTCSHWFSKSQWEFPNDERFNSFVNNWEREQIAKRPQESDRIRQESDRIRQEYDRIRQEYDRIRQEWYKTRAYFDNTHDNMNDVWHFLTTSGKERESAGGHATPKPIALCARAIKTSSREDEIVLDLFGGSGSTLIACEQLNRRCYMIELLPKWADVIIRRWENLTGKTAELISEE